MSLRILFVSANSVPGAHLEVEDEYRKVRAKLRERRNCNVDYNPKATLDDVIDEIEHRKPHIVHFSAHGSPSEEIVLNNQAGEPASVRTQGLEDLFRVMKGNVRLVVMNSCFSARQAKAIAKYIDCVVGVKLKLADDTAISFSPKFYESLAKAKSVAYAYDRAMISVHGGPANKGEMPELFEGSVPPEKIFFFGPKAKHHPAPRAARRSGSRTKGKKLKSLHGSIDPTYQCLRWDIRIDEEGDAYNEMAYAGIVLPARRPYVFPLPAAEVQSGHTTEYKLIRDDRTGDSVSLTCDKVSPSKIEAKVCFVHHPNPDNPAKFAVRCWDWNVYSLNMEEYRQKSNFREDGIDYAEKSIPEPWHSFSMLIQFPRQMVFVRRPFFEIYNPSSQPEEERNDELTASHQHCFYYSSALNLAMLLVDHPPAPYSYRISWQLGESNASAASPLNAVQRQKQRTFARNLLLIRETLETATADKLNEAKRREETINSVLASVAQKVQEILGGAQLDPANLEISLMVLDEDHPEEAYMSEGREPEKQTGSKPKYPVLRIVAGTLLRNLDYRKFFLFVGDGNAGRAWKQRMARFLDPLDEKHPKSQVYMGIPGSPHHRFLVSVPLIPRSSDALIYGILTLGTFSEDQAELLRRIRAPKAMVSLQHFAQSYVLKRLMELPKL